MVGSGEFQWRLSLELYSKKTKGVEYMPISEQAFNLCGEQQEGELLVFAGLPDPSWINRPVKKWVEAAGISKHITFHDSSFLCDPATGWRY